MDGMCYHFLKTDILEIVRYLNGYYPCPAQLIAKLVIRSICFEIFLNTSFWRCIYEGLHQVFVIPEFDSFPKSLCFCFCWQNLFAVQLSYIWTLNPVLWIMQLSRTSPTLLWIGWRKWRKYPSMGLKKYPKSVWSRFVRCRLRKCWSVSFLSNDAVDCENLFLYYMKCFRDR